MPRIVSLIASATEIIHALGMGHFMVARSHECDFPGSVRSLPVCTSPKFATSGNSQEIDRLVKETLQTALSVYHVDEDLLEELQPSLIATQSQCDVCAVSLRDVEAVVAERFGCRPRIVSLQPEALKDIWSDIRSVATALDMPSVGERVVQELFGRMASISERALSASSRPTVACLEWIEPPMAAGNWMPELAEMAGATNLFGIAGEHSPWLNWNDLCQQDPECLVITPC